MVQIDGNIEEHVQPSKFRPELLAPAFVGLFHLWLMSFNAAGNFFNSYPFISDDGFDWLTQGVALVQLITGEDTSAWPVLRPPLFVLVTALDYLFGSRGIVIMLVQSGAVAAIAYLLVTYARGRGLSVFVASLIGLASYFALTSVYHLFVLSDTLASCLMAFSAAAAIRCLETANLRKEGAKLLDRSSLQGTTAPIILASLAGLTQTYGVIAVLVICTTFVGAAILRWQTYRVVVPALYIAFVSAVITFGGQWLWAVIIPHGRQPDQFALLQFNLDMLGLYARLWPLVFGAFVLPAAAAVVYRARYRLLPSIGTLALIGVCLAFAVLSVLYHWADARFTFIYLPIAWMAVVSICQPREPEQAPEEDLTRATRRAHVSGILTASVFASILVGVAFVPTNYWVPNTNETTISPSNSWINNARAQSPADRMNIRALCDSGTAICAEAAYNTWGPYTEEMFAEYKRRMLVEKPETDAEPAQSN